MPSESWEAHIRAVLYGVQFEKDPLDGIDHVMKQVVLGGALHSTPKRYLESIQTALASHASLAELLPQPHSEETVRRYLAELERRIQAVANHR
jgi:hypothetical protein